VIGGFGGTLLRLALLNRRFCKAGGEGACAAREGRSERVPGAIVTDESGRFDMISEAERSRVLRLGVSALLAGMAVGYGLLVQEESVAAEGPLFMGGRPAVEDSEDVITLRLRFPAGVRSHWHSHDGGQLLMVENGKARTQVRGGPLLEIGPGEPWWTGPGVEHWHGAAPDEASHQLTIYSGTVDWLEPVTDVVYRAVPGS